MITSRNTKKNSTRAFGRRINVIGTCMTAFLIILSIVVYKVREISEEDFHVAVPASSFRCFSIGDIKSATQHFSDAFVIGRGGFGKVYKGLIPGIPQMAAIKRLSLVSKQGAREFLAEIKTLSEFRHVNLVSLIGYCNERGEMILVYEHVPGGTLADNLYRHARKGKNCTLLSWEQRLRICIGVAHGLEYLHAGREIGIIHRDVKDTNILLDNNLIPKISDFGLSKLTALTESNSYVSTKVKGIFGYLDPHYFKTRRLTRKSDVYAFGVVMLVALSGKPAVDNQNLGDPEHLVACFKECSAAGDFSKIVDPSLLQGMSSNRIREFVDITDKCLQHTPQARPTMIQVIADLEHALEQHTNCLQQAPPTRQPTVMQHRRVPNDFVSSVAGNERITRPFQDGSTPKPTESLTSLTRGQHSFSVEKTSRVWSWKSVWKKGNKQISEDVQRFGYETLANATRNFDRENRLPYYFGSVYKGVLLNGQQVAVRWLSKSPDLKSAMFRNEVVFMSKLQHPRIIKLVGCCDERSKRMLVYEYPPNGSLDTYISDSIKGGLLDWNRRKIIIQEIARGLHYLHWSLEVSVIHGDLRLNNILLDEELKPKIFGIDFARIQQCRQDSITTFVSSTSCDSDYYMAPESFLEGSLSVKSDVYSYWVMLLEIISGNRERYEHDSKNLNLLHSASAETPVSVIFKSYILVTSSLYILKFQAWKLRSENELIKLVDPGILRADVEWEILRYVKIGLLCVQRDAANRPDAPHLFTSSKLRQLSFLSRSHKVFMQRMKVSRSLEAQNRVCDIWKKYSYVLIL